MKNYYTIEKYLKLIFKDKYEDFNKQIKYEFAMEAQKLSIENMIPIIQRVHKENKYHIFILNEVVSF